jgi:hypothetical protein
LAIAAALVLTVTGAACASSRTVAVGSGPATGPVSNGWKQVRYRNVVLDVPAAWPVIDLARRPRQCVLFNVHALYLGHQGADAACPARALGRTEAVQVEPLDAQTRAQMLPSVPEATINDESVAFQPDGDVTRSVVASFAGLGVAVTATYATNSSIATHVVHSVRHVTGAP